VRRTPVPRLPAPPEVARASVDALDAPPLPPAQTPAADLELPPPLEV
jgi:hypothetical protein